MVDIPHGSVVAAVPDSHVMAMSTFSNFGVAEFVGESLPIEMRDLREKIRLATLLLTEYMSPMSAMRPYLHALPDLSTVPCNAIMLEEARARTLLQPHLPAERVDRFVQATRVLQAQVAQVMVHEGSTSGVLEALSEIYDVPIEQIHVRFRWALAMVYSRSMLLPVVQEKKDENRDDLGGTRPAKPTRTAATRKRAARAQLYQSPTTPTGSSSSSPAPSPTSASAALSAYADEREKAAATEARGGSHSVFFGDQASAAAEDAAKLFELSLVPYLDMCNHADAGFDANVTHNFLPFASILFFFFFFF